MLFMVTEHFKGRDPKPIYARFRVHGRMAPTGLKYHGSWIAKWRDLADFEVIPVVPSSVTADIVTAMGARKQPARKR